MPDPTVVDLVALDRTGPDGAVWSLPHGGDLDANLVHLAPGGVMGAHVNDEVDVLLVAIAGAATVTVDGVPHRLRSGTAIAVPKATRRSIAADQGTEIAYLTVHRARRGLQIGQEA